MKKLSIFLIAALFAILAISSTRSAKADIEVDINGCGCHTSTPSPTPSPSPTASPLPTPSETPLPTQGPNGDGLTPAGPPVCTSAVPSTPIIKSIVRNPTSATINWYAVNSASYYLIFYGTTPGSQQYGVPNTGNVTTYTVGFL